METLAKAHQPEEVEDRWYPIWEEAGLFTAHPEDEGVPFSMVQPPANVTGSLHMGHALTFTIPDIITRRKKMLGFNCLWLPGVDHAGIATQMVVERHLKKTRNISREELGREAFLQEVWSWKDACEGRIVGQLKKLGLSLDWSRMKFTLSEEMNRVVNRVFVSLYQEGRIYQGTYMVHYCPSCRTVLSDLEVEHQETAGTLTHILYPLPGGTPGEGLVVATTRPETLLGDTAVAVHPEDERYRHLVGKVVELPLCGRTIPIIADAHVDPAFGTGAVKVTPAHDPNDHEIGERHNLPAPVVIDDRGCMCGEIPEAYRGLDRFACRRQVVEDLQKAGLVVKIDPHTHNVGACQRCATPIEPLISRQWFLKMKDLARPAINAVEDGRIRFVPEKWQKVYFNWMHNIQDWCISRQLWWGHQIPAWTCSACGHLMVQEEAPEACTRCQTPHPVQDPDVLDTWFSSALWPFSTLGWQNASADFQRYYPTSIMATGFDIIFFWVARMIAMGLHFGGDIPFRDVLINGLIRDEHGVKMSKTKNNVVDPLDIIKEYGADALRFTLAIQAVPGMDISLSVNRIKGYRTFANKIWNASRFVLMNLDGSEPSAFDPEQISDIDRWLLHRLNQTVDEVNTLMDEYRVNDAADRVYHFFWHEFCDWYLEFSKVDQANPHSRRVRSEALLACLQLLHPFMPYITEEIYQHLRQTDEPAHLLLTSFPLLRGDRHFPEAWKRVERLRQLVAEARKTRSENRIDPNQTLRIYLRGDEATERQDLTPLSPYFAALTKADPVGVVASLEGLPKGFKGVLPGWEILLPFDRDEDRLQEIDRLEKEVEKINGFIASLEGKLSNPAFVGKAPQTVVLQTRTSLQEQQDRRDKVQSTLHDLR